MSLSEGDIARRRKIVQDDKDCTSSKISEMARYIGFGLAGLTLIFLTSSSPFAERLVKDFQIPMLLVSAIGCKIILADYLHYYCGHKASEEAYANVDKYTGLCDAKSFYYRARRALFAVKHYLAVVGSFAFIIILLVALF